MTKSELAILQALNEAPEKEMTFDQVRRAARLTPRGFGILFRRLEDARCIGRVDGKLATVSLTFGGLRALRAER